MIILGIDTSCDDTCLSIIKVKSQKSKVKNFKILSNVVSSQVKIHRKYGGVYPALAKREHQRNLVPVLKEALLKAKLLKSKTKNQKLKIHQTKVQKLREILKREKVLYQRLKDFFERWQKPKIDLIAVTIGPGLEPCLWEGVNFAKGLGFWWNLPIVKVNHIEAHILSNWFNNSQILNFTSQIFPAIALIVSGGHTQLILMKKIGDYKLIGETRDDAAGECFDKTARILGLPYPGGPAIAQLAEQQKSQIPNPKFQIKLPRPMINSKDYDFSFSGLKTAVLYYHIKLPEKIKTSKIYISKMAKEIQQAIIDVLVKKTIEAAKDYKAKTILLGGGVAANNQLRKQFLLKTQSLKPKVNLFVPKKNLCTDNGAMVGLAGYFHRKEKRGWKYLKALANLRLK